REKYRPWPLSDPGDPCDHPDRDTRNRGVPERSTLHPAGTPGGVPAYEIIILRPVPVYGRWQGHFLRSFLYVCDPCGVMVRSFMDCFDQRPLEALGLTDLPGDVAECVERPGKFHRGCDIFRRQRCTVFRRNAI